MNFKSISSPKDYKDIKPERKGIQQIQKQLFHGTFCRIWLCFAKNRTDVKHLVWSWRTLFSFLFPPPPPPRSADLLLVFHVEHYPRLLIRLYSTPQSDQSSYSKAVACVRAKQSSFLVFTNMSQGMSKPCAAVWRKRERELVEVEAWLFLAGQGYPGIRKWRELSLFCSHPDVEKIKRCWLQRPWLQDGKNVCFRLSPLPPERLRDNDTDVRVESPKKEGIKIKTMF